MSNFTKYFRALASFELIFDVLSFIRLNMDYTDRNIMNYQSNPTKIVFARMSVPVHARNWFFLNHFHVKKKRHKRLFLLLNGTQYAMPKYGCTWYAGLE